MNNRQYHLIIDLINILLKFLASYTLVGIAILFTTKDTSFVMKAFILLPAPVISYMIGNYVKHIWSFLTLHVLMIAVYTFTNSNGFVIAFYIMYLVILTLIELNNKLQEDKPKKTNSSLFFLFILISMYFVNNYLGTTELNRLAFVLVILFVLFFLLNMYLINFESFFQKHSNMSNIPMKQIKNTNNSLVLFFGSFCLIVMLLFTKLPLKELLSFIGSLLLGILRAFFSLFTGSREEDAPLENMEPTPGASPFDLPDNSSPSLIWQYIQNFILGLFTLIIIAGVIALIIYGLYRIYQRFYEKKNNNSRDKTEFISPFDKREGIDKDTSQSAVKRFLSRFGLSNNDKIRRHFYKAVISHNPSKNLSKSLTPVQLSEYAFTEQGGLLGSSTDPEKVKQLTAYYEKARYSSEECTNEELHLVKGILVKKLR